MLLALLIGLLGADPTIKVPCGFHHGQHNCQHPSVEAPRLELIECGQEISVVENEAEAGWSKVRTKEGGEGYVQTIHYSPFMMWRTCSCLRRAGSRQLGTGWAACGQKVTVSEKGEQQNAFFEDRFRFRNDGVHASQVLLLKSWLSRLSFKRRALGSFHRQSVQRRGLRFLQPVKICDVTPVFSKEAERANFKGLGTVQINAVIGVDGRVRNPKVFKGLGLGLDEKAVEAVRQWKFKPGNEGTLKLMASCHHARIEVIFM